MSRIEIDPRWMELPWYAPAVRALHAAQIGDHAGACAAILEIDQTCGPNGTAQAMLSWVDTALTVCGMWGAAPPSRLSFVVAETGHRHDDVDRLPAEQRWAARLMLARAADDQDGFRALLDALDPLAEADRFAVGRHVLALLNMVAANVNLGAAHPNRALHHDPE